MKKIITTLLCAALLAAAPFAAYASDNGASEKQDSSGVAITVVIPQKESPAETLPTPKPPVNYLYPVSVWESQENGRREIIKTYELAAGEKPEDISRESFTCEGWLFELSDITKKETASADVREHTEKVTIDTSTKEMDAILKMLAPEMEYQTEDGYTGVLLLDISTVQVETAGTKSSSYTVNAAREYLNLSANDTSLVPKTITENGKTLTLSNIQWKTRNTQTVDYDQIADSYTAVATYSGTASKTTVTGYTTTAEYRGTLSKILTGKTVYTAYFTGVPIVTPALNTSSDGEAMTADSLEATADESIIAPDSEESKAECASETTTENGQQPETGVSETDDNNIKEKAELTPLNPLPVIMALLAGGGIGFGLAYYYLVKYQKKEDEKEDDVHHEDEIEKTV